MEQIIKCRSLTAIFQGDKLLLGGPHIVEFDTTDEQKLHQIGIHQLLIYMQSLHALKGS